MKSKRKLTQIFSLMLSSVSLISILLIGALWVSFETTRSTRESQEIRQEFVAAHEATIRLETNRICDYMEAQWQASVVKFLTSLRDKVYEAHSLAEALIQAPGAAADPNLAREMLLAGLGGLSAGQEGSRFFVSTFSGQELSSPGEVGYENLSIQNTATSDYSNLGAFMEILDSLERIKEGFFRYNLIQSFRAVGEEGETQMAFLKTLEPYGWIIGTSEYQETWLRDVQRELRDWAAAMTLPNNNYLMILKYNGDIVFSPDPELRDRNVFTITDNPALQRVAARIIRGAKGGSKNFIRYSPVNPETGQPGEQIGFYRALPDWRWVVVTWVNIEDLETVMAERQMILARNVRSQITKIVIISISMLLGIMISSRVLSALATRSFAAFFSFFEHASTSSMEINPDDQPFEEFTRLALAANEMINQRKLATNLLRESELKFKTIFDVSPQVITISSPEGILLDANEEFQKFSRSGLAAAVGHPLEESFALSGEKRQALWRDLKRAGSIVGREIQTVKPDGSQLEFLVFGRMIHMNVSSFLLVIFTDITALKSAEYEKLVLQEKLARSTKMEAMGLMAAEVAHDLNNILSGIIGYPQLLLMEPNITDKQREALKEILETGQRAAAVVSDLLTIARGVASPKVSLPVNTIVTDYANSPECKQLQDLFPSVTLELQLNPDTGNIMASTVHLTKVVMNLVSNAFEAMPPDRADGRVTVRTENVVVNQRRPGYGEAIEPGHYALIAVQDNGPGIPRDDVNKIFEPFYSKKTKGRSGTGLGLAIVWNTISDHQGRLDLATGPAGTTFSLYFNPTEGKTAAPGARRELADYRGAGQRILVVDDVDIQRKLASKMLTALGYDPVAVPSGEAAVEFLKREDADLVILDMIMHPGMNGRETYGVIMEFKPRQKAIIASGMAETDEVAKAQAMGAGQFVNKPYTIEDLAAAVRKALDG